MGRMGRRRITTAENMMSVKQAAAFMDVHAVTMRNWLRDGRFPHAAKCGRVWRIPESDLLARFNREDERKTA